MGIKLGNDWSPSGDYGTQFKDELGNMKLVITDMIEDLNKYKKELDENSENTKITSDAIELIEGMISKLECSRGNLSISISLLRYYDGGE